MHCFSMVFVRSFFAVLMGLFFLKCVVCKKIFEATDETREESSVAFFQFLCRKFSFSSLFSVDNNNKRETMTSKTVDIIDKFGEWGTSDEFNRKLDIWMEVS